MKKSYRADRNVLIRASAGTGKTYQLSSRYLAALLRGTPTDQILATTFTRKAAGEIQDRVLSRLAEAASDPEKAAELAEAVDLPDLTCRKAAEALRSLVADLHRMRVSTLDAFFNSLARAYSLELGLPAGWRALTETEVMVLRKQAIDDVLATADKEDAVSLLHMLDKGDVKARVLTRLVDAVSSFYDAFEETGGNADAWDRFAPRSRVPAATVDDVVARTDQLIDAYPLNAKGEPSKHQTAVAKLMGIIRTADLDAFAKNTIQQAVTEGREKYDRRDIPDEVRAAVSSVTPNFAAAAEERLRAQTVATFRLLERFDDAFRRRKADARGLHFGDVKRVLADAVARGGGTEDWTHRLDADLRDLLLDEFQDTSLAEWRVIRGFAESVAARQDGGLLCVGDMKQAIYGWRGGLAEIFGRVEQEITPIEVDPLDVSRRSSEAIMEAVNAVFGSLTNHPELPAAEAAAVRLFGNRFKTHTTAKDLPGYAAVEVLPRRSRSRSAGDDEDPDPETAEDIAAADENYDWIARRVEELCHAHEGRTIGVLTRTNAGVTALSARLRGLGIEASEEGGQPVTDSAAVQLLMSLLTVAAHPGDKPARFYVARSPLGEAVGLRDWRSDADAAALSRSLRRTLADRGAGDAIYEWAGHLIPHASRRDVNRLRQLVRLGDEYAASGGDLDGLLTFIAESRVEDPTDHRVTVTTVHKSKGLEYDVVVQAELNKPPHNLHKSGMAAGRGDDLRVNRVYRYASRDLRPLMSDGVQETFTAAETEATVETLCGFYVGMTRARHALHLLVEPWQPKRKKDGGLYASESVGVTAADFVNFAVCGGGDLEPERVERISGSADWDAGNRSSAETDAGPDDDTESAVVIRFAAETEIAAEAATAPSDDGGRTAGDLLADHRARRRGSVMHEWLASIGSLENADLSKATLDRLAFEAGFSVEDIKAAAAAMHRFVRADGPADLLTEPPGADVFRELSFDVVTNDGERIRGTFDRVHRFEDRVTLIDWKTGRGGTDAERQAARERYGRQIGRYRRAAAALFDVPEEAVTARLGMIDSATVIDI